MAKFELTQRDGTLPCPLSFETPAQPRGGGIPTDRQVTMEENISVTSSRGVGQPRRADLFAVLKEKKNIVFVVGAGISVSAGIPDFRSENGIFQTVKRDFNLQGSGQALFSRSVYDEENLTQAFHEVVRKLAKLAESARPTPFHHLLASLASQGRVLRVFSQNIDGLDTLPPLCTAIPLPRRGPWPQVIQLHGSIRKMTCSVGHLSDLVPDIFVGRHKPPCKDRRTDRGRSTAAGLGRRPRFTLYDEDGPPDEAIEAVIEADVAAEPDAVVVVGTSFTIPSVQATVQKMIGVVDASVWINKEPPPKVRGIKWDLIVQRSSDDIASGYFDMES